MKVKFLPLILMGGLLTWALPVVHAEADDAAPAAKVSKKARKGKKNKKKAEKTEEEEVEADAEAAAEDAPESVIATKIKGNTYFTENKPNLKARYFIFLESASWCGPCNAEMPEVAKQYEQMKASGKVELILLSADDTEAEAKGFLDKYKATFPGLMPKGASIPQLPEAKGIPNATIMKADGTVLESGHGSIIRGWKNLTIGKYAVIGDDGEPRVGTAMKDLKFINGKPNRKADFYIYLYAPTPTQADKDLLTDLASEYKEMKKEKVELIFFSNDKTPNQIIKLLKGCKAKFPAALSSAKGMADLPGLGRMGDKPQAWVITQSGASIISGEPDIVKDWQKFVEANQK